MRVVHFLFEFLHSDIGLPVFMCVEWRLNPDKQQWNGPATNREWALSFQPTETAFTMSHQHLSIPFPSFCSPSFSFPSPPISHRPGSHARFWGRVWPFLHPPTHTYAHRSIANHARRKKTAHDVEITARRMTLSSVTLLLFTSISD